MYALVLLVAAVGQACADVSLGYNYKSNSHGSSSLSGSPSYLSPLYGAPYPVIGSPGPYSSGYYGVNRVNNKVVGQSGYQGSNTGYQNMINKFQNGGGNTNENGYQNGADYQSSGNYQPVSLLGGNYQSSLGSAMGNIPANVGNNGVQSYNEFHHSNQYHHKYQDAYLVQNRPAVVFKHFYVHAAPDDEERPKPRHPIVLPPPQKHYKIIFIKTPAQAVSAPQIIPVNQPNEEKTIIYVLVKKPEEIQDIVLPKLEQKPPAKPEVFFIKYNNKERSQTVIDNIVNDYNKGQTVNVNVPNAGSAESSSSGSEYYFNQPTIAPSGGSESSSAASGISSGLSSQSFLGSDGFGAAFGSSSSVGTASTPTLTLSGFASRPLTISTVGATAGTAGVSSEGSGVSSTAGSAYESNDSGVASTDIVTPISTSQGVPHQMYGPPKFRL